MITSFLGRGLEPPPARSRAVEDPAVVKRRDELGKLLGERFAADYPTYAPSAWSYEWQGGGTLPEERSAETLALTEEYYRLGRTTRQMENDLLHRIASADVIELRFEEQLIEAFITTVKTFLLFSDRVEVLLLPRNTEWIRYSPETAARLEEVLRRIERETGLRVVNDQVDERVPPDFFSDTTHLARYSGAVAYTELLIERYAPLLKEAASP